MVKINGRLLRADESPRQDVTEKLCMWISLYVECTYISDIIFVLVILIVRELWQALT